MLRFIIGLMVLVFGMSAHAEPMARQLNEAAAAGLLAPAETDKITLEEAQAAGRVAIPGFRASVPKARGWTIGEKWRRCLSGQAKLINCAKWSDQDNISYLYPWQGKHYKADALWYILFSLREEQHALKAARGWCHLALTKRPEWFWVDNLRLRKYRQHMWLTHCQRDLGFPIRPW